MHFFGLGGIPRRISDYPDMYINWNFVASFDSYLTFLGLLVFFLNIGVSLSPKTVQAKTCVLLLKNL
jgi:heme/copper-type cytochrome/quinol oxidase subunit 1